MKKILWRVLDMLGFLFVLLIGIIIAGVFLNYPLCVPAIDLFVVILVYYYFKTDKYIGFVAIMIIIWMLGLMTHPVLAFCGTVVFIILFPLTKSLFTKLTGYFKKRNAMLFI